MADSWVQYLEQSYKETNDLETLLEGLQHLRWSHRADDVGWLITAVEKCVRECLARQPASRTSNRLSRLVAREEDTSRLEAVLRYAGSVRCKYGSIRKGKGHLGVPKTRAYEIVAKERAEATGVHVGPVAIRQSCTRAIRRKFESLPMDSEW